MAREYQPDGAVGMDEFSIGVQPAKDADRPHLGRGSKGQPWTTKTPVLAEVQRPSQSREDSAAGDARARVVTDLSEREARRVPNENVDAAIVDRGIHRVTQPA
jgi:hypothetical protein